jgi:hypothetical protein
LPLLSTATLAGTPPRAGSRLICVSAPVALVDRVGEQRAERRLALLVDGVGEALVRREGHRRGFAVGAAEAVLLGVRAPVEESKLKVWICSAKPLT